MYIRTLFAKKKQSALKNKYVVCFQKRTSHRFKEEMSHNSRNEIRALQKKDMLLNKEYPVEMVELELSPYRM